MGKITLVGQKVKNAIDLRALQIWLNILYLIETDLTNKKGPLLQVAISYGLDARVFQSSTVVFRNQIFAYL